MPFQILSLSGGGFLGLYTVTVLDEFEQSIGKPIVECFDLIAGTSIGGIVALGLSAGKPAAEIRRAFEKNGPSIFSERAAPRTKLGAWRDVCRSLFSVKYSSEALRATIIEVVGESTRIVDLRTATIIPTVNLTKGKPQLFKTPHHETFQRDWKLRVVDVALATSAAPTYFPIAEIGDELFIDGGLYANAPDMLALHEAEYFLKVPLHDIRMLSVGTTTTRLSFSHVGSRNLGVFGWGQKLPQAMISSQQMDVEYILRHKLDSSYVRIDTVQSKDQERDLGLDVANANAQKTIRGLASGAVQENMNNAVLQSMWTHQAPPTKFFHGKS